MRHRWFKWKTHYRMCTKCGTVKVSVQKGQSNYLTEYHMADGRLISVPTKTPPCGVGDRTNKRLTDLQNWIARHPSAAAVQNIAVPIGAPA